jgi:FHA domain
MTWFVELMHRDGSVLLRTAVSGTDFRIGRALDNDLVIDDPHCAAYHARLSVDADGTATLQDLNSRNGITPARSKKALTYAVLSDEPYRLGHTNIRIRHGAWPVPAERPMAMAMWPFALTALVIVLLHLAWKIWLTDVNQKSPPYLSDLVGAAVALSVWSGMYALLGRLISGAERFFTHLLIACCGYLVITLAERLLELLSFATAWLSPMRIEQYVLIVLIALLVRAHLRVADPRHWPVLRWTVGLAAMLAMLVPVAQLWISSQRLTNVQTLKLIEYPMLRVAKPQTLEKVTESVALLKSRVDAARTKDDNADELARDDD